MLSLRSNRIRIGRIMVVAKQALFVRGSFQSLRTWFAHKHGGIRRIETVVELHFVRAAAFRYDEIIIFPGVVTTDEIMSLVWTSHDSR